MNYELKHLQAISRAMEDMNDVIEHTTGEEQESYKEYREALQDVYDNLKTNEGHFYPITSITKEDIIQAFNDYEYKHMDDIKKAVEIMEEHDMVYFASKLADDYCNQLFWDSVRIIFESRFLNDSKFLKKVNSKEELK